MTGVQWSVSVFFAGVWTALAIILRVAPDTYSLAAAGIEPITIFLGISILIAVCVTGAVRRWRWLFWIVLLAFLGGGLRIAISALAVTGVVPLDGPRWYVVAQGAVGAVQLAIGITMLRAYRRRGIWGYTAAERSRPMREVPSGR